MLFEKKFLALQAVAGQFCIEEQLSSIQQILYLHVEFMGQDPVATLLQSKSENI
ncbi:MAG: hypothetical protein ABW078_00795 [Sedimenticola sp.]